jgi:hypothetical protein
MAQARAHQKRLLSIVGTALVRWTTRFGYSFWVIDFEVTLRYESGRSVVEQVSAQEASQPSVAGRERFSHMLDTFAKETT